MKGFLPTYRGCVICGERRVNPAAMRVRFYWDGDKIDTEVHPDKTYAGYRGIMHGGMITALLDEAMGWAAAVERRCYFITGELNIHFLHPVPLNRPLRVVARCQEHRERYSSAAGELRDEEGNVLARGEGKFYKLPHNRAIEIKNYLHFKEGDIDVLAAPGEGADNV